MVICDRIRDNNSLQVPSRPFTIFKTANCHQMSTVAPADDINPPGKGEREREEEKQRGRKREGEREREGGGGGERERGPS